MPVTVGTLLVNAGVGAANVISGIKDTNKRRDVELALANISQDQRAKLEKQIANAKNENERLELVLKLASEKKGQKEKNDLITASIIVGGGLLFLVAIIIYKKNR